MNANEGENSQALVTPPANPAGRLVMHILAAVAPEDARRTDNVARDIVASRHRAAISPQVIGTIEGATVGLEAVGQGAHVTLHAETEMSLLTFTTVEDAYYYYSQAKAISTKERELVKQRHLRTAVILGWVAVDDAVASWAQETDVVWPRACRGPTLFPRILFIFKQLGLPTPNEAEFSCNRRIRNRIAHPSGSSDITLTLSDVADVLAYCEQLIKAMYPRLFVKERYLQLLK